jgi:hypothetical protein
LGVEGLVRTIDGDKDGHALFVMKDQRHHYHVYRTNMHGFERKMDGSSARSLLGR